MHFLSWSGLRQCEQMVVDTHISWEWGTPWMVISEYSRGFSRASSSCIPTSTNKHLHLWSDENDLSQFEEEVSSHHSAFLSLVKRRMVVVSVLLSLCVPMIFIHKGKQDMLHYKIPWMVCTFTFICRRGDILKVKRSNSWPVSSSPAWVRSRLNSCRYLLAQYVCQS